MPSNNTYPGVYVEEVSYRNRINRCPSIETAFLGRFPSGPIGQSMPVASSEQLELLFGADAVHTVTGRAIRLFLENGGLTPLVVRINDDVAVGLASLPSTVNLLLIPDTASLPTDDALIAISLAQTWADSNHAFFILDAPDGSDATTIADWLADHPTIRHRGTALYFPGLYAADGTAIPPSGAVAGVYVRTDLERGVWKVPAGIAAGLRGVTALGGSISRQELETFNPLGINAIRETASGPAVWGARTLSSDPEWKYVSVSRLSSLIEESIDRGTQWAVFEPNDQPLWASVHQLVADFLHDLWHDGALRGEKPADAYFVKCGQDTMTTADVDHGRLIMHVGFAPLKPAEFVVLRVVQKTLSSPDIPRSGLSRLLRTASHLTIDQSYQILFSGPSGTGKTLAARALASELHRPLARIDLAQIVSKYISETEKNLARVLATAAGAHSILFFDEADALFGKRTSVRPAHGRHADLEVGYLLEQIEDYPGIVILGVKGVPYRREKYEVVAFDRTKGKRSPPRSGGDLWADETT